MSLHQLPDDIIRAIGQHLTLAERDIAAQTCKRIHQLIRPTLIELRNYVSDAIYTIMRSLAIENKQEYPVEFSLDRQTFFRMFNVPAIITDTFTKAYSR